MGPGDVVDDRFEIERPAGPGGMGYVYRARDLQTGDAAALKLFQRSGARQLGRISREAQALAMLREPGVVRYVGHGVAGDGHAYLAMEWLDGETLEQHIAQRSLTTDSTASSPGGSPSSASSGPATATWSRRTAAASSACRRSGCSPS